ncbi:hypothetical protein BsWGS_21804 [Bradybaena similaris]
MDKMSTIFQNNIVHKSISPLDLKTHLFPELTNGKRTRNISGGSNVYNGKKYDYIMRIILLGDQGSGKSTFMKALNIHPDVKKVKHLCRVGMATDHLEIETVTSAGKMALVRLCDTGGQERYRSLTSSYYRGAHGVLLLFDLKHQTSLDNVDSWLADLDTYSSAASCTRVLLGSNCTAKDRTVPPQTARRYAENRSLPYIEFDSTQFYNVIESLQLIVERIAKEVTLTPASPLIIRPSSLSQEQSQDKEIQKFTCQC